jgi:hypothetical protein
MREHGPENEAGTSYINGKEKSPLDKIRDDYVAKRISKEEYGKKFREEIDRRQKIMSAPKMGYDANDNGNHNGA